MHISSFFMLLNLQTGRFSVKKCLSLFCDLYCFGTIGLNAFLFCSFLAFILFGSTAPTLPSHLSRYILVTVQFQLFTLYKCNNVLHTHTKYILWNQSVIFIYVCVSKLIVYCEVGNSFCMCLRTNCILYYLLQVTKKINEVVKQCNDDFHAADVFTNPILEEQHTGIRKLQGAIKTIEELERGQSGYGLQFAEYVFDQKMVKGEIP